MFITVEGVDGAGKSSHIDAIVETIRAETGRTVVSTREPGGTALGERLREMILHEPMALTTEILLAFASRAEHLERVIRPALARGDVVVCDRFTDSTYAYQGAGREGPIQMIQDLEQSVHADVQPTLTLLFDLPVDLSMARLGLTGKTADKFESMSPAFFERVRAGYHARAARDERFVVIDSSKPLDEVRIAVRESLVRFLENRDRAALKAAAPAPAPSAKTRFTL